MKPGGKSDDDVAAFRYCLVEFDLDESGNRIPLQTQWEYFVDSGLPITAVSFSGDKSLHGLVCVDAANKTQFDARRAKVWQVFKGLPIDDKNKNPSRYSRAPGFERTLYDKHGAAIGTGKQELLYLGLGPASWDEYENSQTAFVQWVCGTDIKTKILDLPQPVICGLLSRGEKGELAGGSKSFKTWSLINQGLAVANGADWWGFKTARRNAIFLNLEIPQPYFEARVREVAKRLGLDIPANFYVWHGRKYNLGDADCWNRFLKELERLCRSIPNPHLISDPVYKLLGGRNENDAGQVQLLLQQLEDMIQSIDGSNFFGHHFAKGNAAGKEPIDRASGSGVFQRDPGTICVMTPHENPGCFTLELIVRNHPPLDSFVLEWKPPIFARNGSDSR
jgi:RecA-family ATPase